MIRRGPWKFIYSRKDPALLYDIRKDPGERHNLAPLTEHQALVEAFKQEVSQRWNLEQLSADVLASQRRRRFVARALTKGNLKSWDHQPHFDASNQYMRNHIDLDDLERRARFPAV